LGQIIGLSLVLLALTAWRRSAGFSRYALIANTVLMTGGFLLTGYQLSGYLLNPA
jgi:hypothetical protein